MEFTYSLYNNRCPFVFCRKYTRKELKLKSSIHDIINNIFSGNPTESTIFNR